MEGIKLFICRCFRCKTWWLSGKSDFLHRRLNGLFRNNLKCRLSGSAGTDLQSSSVEGSKFWTECVMAYISISILYFPKLCLGSYQILNLSQPTKKEQELSERREKSEYQQNLTGRTGETWEVAAYKIICFTLS